MLVTRPLRAAYSTCVEAHVGEVLDNEWYFEGLVDAGGASNESVEIKESGVGVGFEFGVRFPRILVIVASVAVQGDTSVPYSRPHLRPEVISDSVAPYGERQILARVRPRAIVPTIFCESSPRSVHRSHQSRIIGKKQVWTNLGRRAFEDISG